MLLVVLALLVGGAHSQQATLIDFTYSHVLPEMGGSGERQGGFDLQPSLKSA